MEKLLYFFDIQKIWDLENETIHVVAKKGEVKTLTLKILPIFIKDSAAHHEVKIQIDNWKFFYVGGAAYQLPKHFEIDF